MKKQLLAVALLLGLLGFFAFAPISEALAQTPKPPNPFKNIPINGTVAGGGTLAGELRILFFLQSDGQLFARGIVYGGVTDSAGAVSDRHYTTVSLPVLAATAECHRLHLELGQGTLTLLDHQVELHGATVDMTSQQVSRALLCRVSERLNVGASLNTLAHLLTRLILSY